MFSLFGRKRAPVEQPAALQESQQGDFVVFGSPVTHEPPPQAAVDPPVTMETQRSPPPANQPHGIDGVPFQLNTTLSQSGTATGEVDALLRRLRAMGDLSWTEYDYSVERRIVRDYA
ncbi:hypothetical protein HPB50_004979 [Hyalomma asiaticum]|uniref:Uncharacterized protein n=1 Tax=Hyalomma asiaticum TaxID=266040 RepID=A0ACB7SXM0_HYAAI|nr:hypothetical protein HPB50_004979 [Hyalomma asiaticum]